MITGILGSGREHGNSSLLLAEALEAAAKASGLSTRLVSLSRLCFRGCVGCGACRTTAEECVLRDDLTEILAQTSRARALVLAAPIYYGYPSGLFKSYLDRWYSFRGGDRRLRIPEGRPALLILTQGHPDPATYGWTIESLDKVLVSYGLTPDVLLAPGLEKPDGAARSPALLAEARLFGERLGRAIG